MTELSQGLFEYHQRSKHRVNHYAPGPTGLDWANQPDPFREFPGAAQLKLPLAADSLVTRYNELRRGDLPPACRFDLGHVAILFELSLGLSAWNPLVQTAGHCAATLLAAIYIRQRAICCAHTCPACTPGSITT